MATVDWQMASIRSVAHTSFPWPWTVRPSPSPRIDLNIDPTWPRISRLLFIMSIRQLRVIQKGGPITFVTATIPKPGPHELCIRPRAVSLNPVDYKNLRYGVAIQSWPAVLGIEGAGVVESVGADVTSFKPGDEVVSLVETKIRDGVFQDMYTAAEVSCMKKPSNLSFEEATSLP